MDTLTEFAGGLVPSVLLIVVLLLIRRRVSGGARPRDTSRMRVVERTGVSRGASVAVVEIDQRRFLVGATEHGISLLSELQPTEVDVTAPARSATDVSTSGPKDELAGLSETQRPWSGLVHRLQRMTVRTHVEEPLRELT